MASKALISCSASPLTHVSNKASTSPSLAGFRPSNVSFSSSSSSPSSKLFTSRASLVVTAQHYEGGVDYMGVQVPTTTLVHSPWTTTEDEHELKVRLDVPGVVAEDIDVKVEGDVLVVKDLGRQLYSPYDTRLQLPPNAVKQAIKAFLKNGVLHVTVPKYTRIEPHVIHVPVRLV
ncbi:hypothetical protein Cgig2_019316 [Carnegiea gigantea]|uniref:SHSP domain-containing protein n=1 Tax=Carnegiea gigantea TaxID=171969 RepID=A0A9Q1KN39_9CARY|nr:hypothetical protein Cgig2_019316 [Carnegiea gigantea]